MSAAEVINIGPQPGPQEKVLTSEADIRIYGGAAGGGKSWVLQFDPVRGLSDPNFVGIIFRRTTTQLDGGSGTLWVDAQELYAPLNPKVNQTKMTLTFPSGAVLKFAHLQHAKDKLSHQGKQYTYVGFDELTHFEQEQFWYLISRLRSISGWSPWLNAGTNPEANHWVRDLVDWWIDEHGDPIPERDGVLRYFVRSDDGAMLWVGADYRDEDGDPPMSITFIASSLEDNQILMKKDPQYRKMLKSLPRVERMKLLDGNWNASQINGVFEHHNINKRGIHPSEVPTGLKWIRYWDMADTEPGPKNKDPDWTAGVLMALHVVKGVEHIYIKDIVHVRLTGGKKQAKMKATAVADGVDVVVGFEQEPGGSGKELALTYQTVVFAGFHAIKDRPTGDKEARANRWIVPAEEGNVHLVQDDPGHKPSWADAFISELESFPFMKKDQIDAVSGGYKVLKSMRTRRIKKASATSTPRRMQGGW